MAKLSLYFCQGDQPQLYKSAFKHPLCGNAEIVSVRGKEGSLYAKTGSFQWTSGVQALAIIVLKAKLFGDESSTDVLLSGEANSLAATIDYALTKQPVWLSEMFGWDSNGDPIARRLFWRTNSERKRPGPVVVSLNLKQLGSRDIYIFENDNEVEDRSHLLNLLTNLTKDSFLRKKYTPKKNREAAADVNAVFGVDSSSKHSDDWKSWLKEIYREELSYILSSTNIFSKPSLTQSMVALNSLPTFKKLSGNELLSLHSIEEELATSERLGVANSQDRIEKILTEMSPISVAISPALLGSLAIFTYMKHVKGYQFEIDFQHAHSTAIMLGLRSFKFERPPALCVFGIAATAAMLQGKKNIGYSPLMIMPRISQKIVAPPSWTKIQSKQEVKEFLFMTDIPSDASIFYGELCNQNILRKSSIALQHMEPHDITAALIDGCPETRAILWFPHYQLNQRLNGCHLVSPIENEKTAPRSISELNASLSVLFHNKDVFRDGELLRSINVAIRNSWLELRENPVMANHTIDLILNDSNYIKFLQRCGGLYSLPGKNPFLDEDGRTGHISGVN